jgi:hypothetical protein
MHHATVVAARSLSGAVLDDAKVINLSILQLLRHLLNTALIFLFRPFHDDIKYYCQCFLQ